MSPRTKARRRRRKAVAGLACLLRSEPKRTDDLFVQLAGRDSGVLADMAFYATHMRWEMAHNIALMTRSYDAAYAIVHPEL